MFRSLPAAVTRPMARGTELLRGALGGLTWGPALAVAKPAVLSVFSQIEVGTLLLVDEPAGTRRLYGQTLGGADKLDVLPSTANPVRKATSVPRVELVIKKEAFWMRLFLFADMGFAEAYMLGEVECADLTAFFQVSGCPAVPRLRLGAARLGATHPSDPSTRRLCRAEDRSTPEADHV